MSSLQIQCRRRRSFFSAETTLPRNAGLAILLLVTLTPVMAGQGAGSDTGARYYVATTGNDSDPGTLAQPFLTLRRGVSAAGPGDTIIVRDGTYPGGCRSNSSYALTINKAGTPAAWITLKAENKWAATLDAENVCHSFINLGANAAYWVIQDFRIINGYSGGIWTDSGADYITMRGNEIAYIGRHYLDSAIGICGSYADASSHDLIYDGNVLHDIGRTGGPQTAHDHALYVHSPNSTIVNNVFYQPIQGWGIQTASGFSGLIANNTFHGPNATREGHIMLWDSTGTVIIRNNIFYAPRRQAITQDIFSSTSCTVDNNIVFGAGVSLGAPSACSSDNNRLNTDPMLVNATTAPYDFHLTAGSPAIDTGATVPAAPADIDGVPRPQGSAYDVGAYEYYGDVMSLNRPYFEAASVVNAASFLGGLSPGAFATIFGLRLSNGATGAGSPPFPTVLADTRVSLAGLPVGLLYASPQQINFAVPAGMPMGPASLVVSTPDGDSSPVAVTIQAAAPGIFVLPGAGNAGVIVPSGAEMTIYCTGLGAVNPTTGQTLLPVTVRVGGQALTPSFGGWNPDNPGLYLVKSAIPSGLTGVQTVSIEVNGIRSNEVQFLVP
jgi:uncharacterized protein (TIGR03437 family)